MNGPAQDKPPSTPPGSDDHGSPEGTPTDASSRNDASVEPAEPGDSFFAFIHGLRAAHRENVTPGEEAIRTSIEAARDRLLDALQEEPRIEAQLPSSRRVRAAIRLEAWRQGRGGDSQRPNPHKKPTR